MKKPPAAKKRRTDTDVDHDLAGLAAHVAERTPEPKAAKKPKATYRRFDETKQREYIRQITENKLGRIAAARAVGVDASTARRHVAADKKFAEAVSLAEMAAEGEKIEDVEDALYQAAIGGNVTAIQVFLYNRAADRWSDRRNLQLHMPPDEAARKLAAILSIGTADLPT